MTTTLARLERGQLARIMRIDDPGVRAQALRFGIGEGAEIACQERVPFGPVIIRKGRQEIAIGRNLAGRITVEV
ncbi:MAG: ferrous iron transport protein A [Bacillota bacterium]